LLLFNPKQLVELEKYEHLGGIVVEIQKKLADFHAARAGEIVVTIPESLLRASRIVVTF
jgi:hypothetical protein